MSPIEDRDTEDVWKDFYTGEVVQNYTHPWLRSKPNGGEAENCSRLKNEKNWTVIVNIFKYLFYDCVMHISLEA